MKPQRTTNKDMQDLYNYLDKIGVSYTVDRNPSPEKIAEIKAKITKKEEILKAYEKNILR